MIPLPTVTAYDGATLSHLSNLKAAVPCLLVQNGALSFVESQLVSSLVLLSLSVIIIHIVVIQIG